MEGFLGVDVGAVSTNVVLIDEKDNIAKKVYLRTCGDPIKALKNALRVVRDELDKNIKILGAGATGSGRYLAGALIGADIIKNEITAHAFASIWLEPDVKTIFEIGGQDSKIIIIRNGVAVDFAMNTVCAAGTGAFLDQQSARLGIPVENLGSYALKSKQPVRIAGRCTVFAESDMIHKQQLGYLKEDIIAGLCESMVRNYLSNVGKGKEILPPIMFQGGVAANPGIKAAFEKILGQNIFVPEHFDVMGAIGAALASKNNLKQEKDSNFKGFEIIDRHFSTDSFNCMECPNECEVLKLLEENQTVSFWGDICGKFGETCPRQESNLRPTV